MTVSNVSGKTLKEADEFLGYSGLAILTADCLNPPDFQFSSLDASTFSHFVSS